MSTSYESSKGYIYFHTVIQQRRKEKLSSDRRRISIASRLAQPVESAAQKVRGKFGRYKGGFGDTGNRWERNLSGK